MLPQTLNSERPGRGDPSGISSAWRGGRAEAGPAGASSEFKLPSIAVEEATGAVVVKSSQDTAKGKGGNATALCKIQDGAARATTSNSK